MKRTAVPVNEGCRTENCLTVVKSSYKLWKPKRIHTYKEYYIYICIELQRMEPARWSMLTLHTAVASFTPQDNGSSTQTVNDSESLSRYSWVFRLAINRVNWNSKINETFAKFMTHWRWTHLYACAFISISAVEGGRTKDNRTLGDHYSTYWHLPTEQIKDGFLSVMGVHTPISIWSFFYNCYTHCPFSTMSPM